MNNLYSILKIVAILILFNIVFQQVSYASSLSQIPPTKLNFIEKFCDNTNHKYPTDTVAPKKRNFFKRKRNSGFPCGLRDPFELIELADRISNWLKPQTSKYALIQLLLILLWVIFFIPMILIIMFLYMLAIAYIIGIILLISAILAFLTFSVLLISGLALSLWLIWLVGIASIALGTLIYAMIFFFCE